MEDKISWKKEFSLATNRFVLKDLFKVILITTVIFQLFIVLIVFFYQWRLYELYDVGIYGYFDHYRI